MNIPNGNNAIPITTTVPIPIHLNNNKDDMPETHLIPAAVPHQSPQASDRIIITEQPTRISLTNDTKSSTDPNRAIQHHYSRRSTIRPQQSQSSEHPKGLASLAVAEELSISIDQGFLRCNSDYLYSIKDVTNGEDSLIFEAIETGSCCSFGSLRNVVIRDREEVPVARVCFKEKYFFLHSLVLAVYSPPEVLVGTIEEDSSCSVLSSKFILGNADGDNLFQITYNGTFFNPHFSIESLVNNREESVAKIQEKSSCRVKLKFLSKLNITNKLILMGFCIGMVNKRTQQQLQAT